MPLRWRDGARAEMDAADIEAVSTIRVRGWQAAYAGIVPQTYLDAMTVEGDAAQRRQWFSQSGRKSRDLVALGDRGPVGWICFGPCRTERPGLRRVGEVYALYISPDLIGQGIGRILLGEAHTQMRGQGFEASALWVRVTTNEPSASTSELATRLAVRLRTTSTTGSHSLSSATSACFESSDAGRTLVSSRDLPLPLQGPSCRFPLTATRRPSTIRSMLDPELLQRSPRVARNWTKWKKRSSLRKCGPSGMNSPSPIVP